MPFVLFPKSESRTRETDLFGTRSAGLDLRREVHEFLHGTEKETGHGFWIVLRTFDRSQYRKAYNRATGDGVFFQPTGEALDGHGLYPYTDTPIRTCTKELVGAGRRGFGEFASPIGVIPSQLREFYVEYSVKPTTADLLFEIDYEGTKPPPSVTPPYLVGWNIQSVHPYRDRGGRVEYYAVLAHSLA